MAQEKSKIHIKKNRDKKRRPGVNNKNKPPEKAYRGQGRKK